MNLTFPSLNLEVIFHVPSIPLHRSPLDLSTHSFHALNIHQRRYAHLQDEPHQVWIFDRKFAERLQHVVRTRPHEWFRLQLFQAAVRSAPAGYRLFEVVPAAAVIVVSAGLQQEIARLDVTMDQLLGMSGGQTFRDLRVEYLNCNHTLQLFVDGAKHDAESTLAQDFQNFVVPDPSQCFRPVRRLQKIEDGVFDVPPIGWSIEPFCDIASFARHGKLLEGRSPEEALSPVVSSQ